MGILMGRRPRLSNASTAHPAPVPSIPSPGRRSPLVPSSMVPNRNGTKDRDSPAWRVWTYAWDDGWRSTGAATCRLSSGSPGDPGLPGGPGHPGVGPDSIEADALSGGNPRLPMEGTSARTVPLDPSLGNVPRELGGIASRSHPREAAAGAPGGRHREWAHFHGACRSALRTQVRSLGVGPHPPLANPAVAGARRGVGSGTGLAFRVFAARPFAPMATGSPRRGGVRR
jgi:hypothetical protein